MYCNDIHVVDVVECHDVNCMSHEHIEQIDQLYTQLCSVLKHANDDSIPVCKIHTHHDYIVPGFNKFAKQLYTVRHVQIISYGRRRVSLEQDYCILICVSLGLDLSVH